MTAPRYIFVDDAIGDAGDAERYRSLLQKAGQLQVDLMPPNRERLLAPEADIDGEIDGFILDINLSDQVDASGKRFLGTGAGLAQDLRLLQSLGAEKGQRPRPVIRLCAAQVFQDYLAGDNSTADLFDLGFDKEIIGDFASQARAMLAALPGIYAAVEGADSSAVHASGLLGIDLATYARLHSRFKGALETELTRKTHEAVGFLLRQFLDAPGILIGEELLSIRLGVDAPRSPGWQNVCEFFAPARYSGAGSEAFPRWWNDLAMSRWAEVCPVPLFKLSSEQRVAKLAERGFRDLTPYGPSAYSPGENPWLLAASNDAELRLPVDPKFAFPLNAPTAPWLDEPVWCFEQAKRNRNSPRLTEDARGRLQAALSRPGPKVEG